MNRHTLLQAVILGYILGPLRQTNLSESGLHELGTEGFNCTASLSLITFMQDDFINLLHGIAAELWLIGTDDFDSDILDITFREIIDTFVVVNLDCVMLLGNDDHATDDSFTLHVHGILI